MAALQLHTGPSLQTDAALAFSLPFSIFPHRVFFKQLLMCDVHCVLLGLLVAKRGETAAKIAK
jgi:hypothetical protein